MEDGLNVQYVQGLDSAGGYRKRWCLAVRDAQDMEGITVSKTRPSANMKYKRPLRSTGPVASDAYSLCITAASYCSARQILLACRQPPCRMVEISWLLAARRIIIDVALIVNARERAAEYRNPLFRSA